MTTSSFFAEHPAGGVDLIDHHLHRVLLGLAQKGGRAGDGQHGPDLDGVGLGRGKAGQTQDGKGHKESGQRTVHAFLLTRRGESKDVPVPRGPRAARAAPFSQDGPCTAAASPISVQPP